MNVGFDQSNATLGTMVILLCRTVIALLFMAAGLAKLFNVVRFREIVQKYDLIPRGLANDVAVLIPVVESLIGISLLFGLMVSWAGAAAGVLLSLFAAAVGINLLRGRRDISCGCFGFHDEEKLSWDIVLRNTLLASVALAISLHSGNTSQLSIAEKLATVAVAIGLFSLAGVYRSLRTASRQEEVLDLKGY